MWCQQVGPTFLSVH